MFKNLKLEIQRCLRVLGIDRGNCRNEMDIDGWLADGFINKEEARELRKYNNKLSSTM